MSWLKVAKIYALNAAILFGAGFFGSVGTFALAMAAADNPTVRMLLLWYQKALQFWDVPGAVLKPMIFGSSTNNDLRVSFAIDGAVWAVLFTLVSCLLIVALAKKTGKCI